ncbi:MAG: YceH family protein [Thermogutta sp.]
MNEDQRQEVNRTSDQATRRWRALPPIERRVIGVLVEKAKTTPSAYPMTLNAIVTGCNQKSNRDPVMDLNEEVVDRALENLRQMGAVGIVQGLGRVDKYRHYLYEWLGVEKEELSIMAELLLRGPQTEGELRAHVSRMDPIPDLPTLRQHLDCLIEKGLVIHLTPPGRGHTVAHNLYPEPELARLKQRYLALAITDADFSEDHALHQRGATSPQATAAVSPTDRSHQASFEGTPPSRELEELRGQVKELRDTVARLAEDVERLKRGLGV